MIEIRFHGRGGQGAVVASKLLASALFAEGKSVQSFPSFGVERRGAPVMAFLRIDNHPIKLRTNVYNPDHIIVLDATLVEAVDVTSGLKPKGWIILNSDHSPEEFTGFASFRVATVDATKIAVENHLGSRTHPIVNTAILGAFSKVTGLVSIEAVAQSIREAVPAKTEENARAAVEAYDKTVLPSNDHPTEG
ncbi:MAG: pyruvate ferredoxin oxidoreductase [Proteobacteria bacterium]|nr:pyruvate ferredoxin oxidoreductase [Pseudomonadota bacterium]NIS71097.1 pyruvate ferredoxin oxidoreductase [Pseudomonadota bacterium]